MKPMIFQQPKAKAKTVKKAKPKEKVLHQQICDYLNIQYPEVIFTSDASGARVTIGLRVELKRKRCRKYKIPDLIILHPSNGYNGLVMEIKRDKSEWYDKKGIIKINNNHVFEQWQSLDALEKRGYKAVVGCGFDECKNIIDNYLKAA